MEERGVELLAPLAEVTCSDNPAGRDDPIQPVSAEDVHRLPKNASSHVYDKQAFVYDKQPFAVIKACFGLRRILLRGLPRVQAEFQWACSAFNLKKLMSIIATLCAAGGNVIEKTEFCGTQKFCALINRRSCCAEPAATRTSNQSTDNAAESDVVNSELVA